MRIRVSYVLLGGQLAGLIINVIEFVVNGLVLRDAWAETMRRLGRPEVMTAGQTAAGCARHVPPATGRYRARSRVGRNCGGHAARRVCV